MDLAHDLNLAPLLRPLGLPANLGNVCLIALQGDLERVPALLRDNPGLRPQALVIPDLPEKTALKLRIEIDGRVLQARKFGWLGECPQFEKIFVCPQDTGMVAAALSQIGLFLASMAVQTIWLYGGAAPDHSIRQPMPDFFGRNMERLGRARDLFADEESKRVFTGRLKALLSGNSGFIPIAPHREYFHPFVRPQDGDIMIDGGVSDMVGIQREFSRAVGQRGQVFGFEPIPSMAQSAGRQLAEHSNYHMCCAGLAQTSGEAFFDDLRDSSHMSAGGEPKDGQVRCALTSIDDFCAKNHLGRIDCIKLDVEGAELEALKGAAATIKRCRPRLIVCLYHKPADMYEIPFWIKEIEPDYELYLAHSSCQFMDSILYARCGADKKA